MLRIILCCSGWPENVLVVLAEDYTNNHTVSSCLQLAKLFVLLERWLY